LNFLHLHTQVGNIFQLYKRPKNPKPESVLYNLKFQLNLIKKIPIAKNSSLGGPCHNGIAVVLVELKSETIVNCFISLLPYLFTFSMIELKNLKYNLTRQIAELFSNVKFDENKKKIVLGVKKLNKHKNISKIKMFTLPSS
jgi:hypothetical protein